MMPRYRGREEPSRERRRSGRRFLLYERHQGGELTLAAHLSASLDRVEALESEVQALLPEPDRVGRLSTAVVALQARFPEPRFWPPLYGCLVAVKDIIRVDGLPTRAGSSLPPELFAGEEAGCVSALRRAGALVLGKSVTTEFAYFEPGPTRNPRALGHTPGGSSSGSAAAVAAGYCPLAIGTQTVGSVIRPASFCGVVGYKPSFGRVDRSGVVPFSPAVDTVGLLARDTTDAKTAAGVLCTGWEDRGPASAPVLAVPVGPYLEQASREGLGAFARQVEGLEAAGYEVRRVTALAEIEAVNLRHRRLISGEVARVHAEWFPRYRERYRPRIAEIILRGQQIDEAELVAARSGCLELRRLLEEALSEAGADLWICPAACGPAPAGLESTGDPAMNLPWTHAGLPVVTVPAGTVGGLPVGLQLAARFGADEELLAWAEGLAEILAGIGEVNQIQSKKHDTEGLR